MRRRELLSKTGGACLAPAAIVAVGAAASPGLAAPATVPTASAALLRTYLTSLPATLPSALEPGMRLVLRRTPERAYDRRSIAAYGPGGERLGYLPGRPTHGLAALMDQGLQFVAEVVACAKGKRPAVTVDLHRQTVA